MLPAEAFQLLSHRAFYELSLLPGRGGDVTDVTGRMVIEWVDVCDGYTTNQRMIMRITHNDGKAQDSDFHLSSWEDKSGDSFRFDVRTTIGRQAPEIFKGRATRKGGVGKAVFKQPVDLDVPLPGDVVFPSEHMARLIDAAMAGERRIALPVFDGSGKDGLYEAIGFVLGPDNAKPSTAPKSSQDLARRRMPKAPAWRVRLSFFDFSSRDALPSYEVSLRLFATGVVDQLILDYSDFAVVGKLSNLKVLESVGC
jgi:hypothetical protein